MVGSGGVEGPSFEANEFLTEKENIAVYLCTVCSVVIMSCATLLDYSKIFSLRDT